MCVFNFAIGKKTLVFEWFKTNNLCNFFKIVNIRVRITVSKYKLLITWYGN